MDYLKNQIQRIQQQLAGLNASQKMLTAALVAVMVMTLLYWGRYAGTAEMVPLLDQTLSPTEMGQIQQRIRAKGIPFDVKADRIVVPADRQAELYADLAWSKMLPMTTEAGFEMMVKKLNPWAPASERDAMFNRAKEITCAQIIGLLPDVEVVRVMIDPAQKRQIGAKLEPAAVVTIATRNGGGDPKKLAEAAGAIVKGAEAALSLNRISVVINQTTHRLRDPGQDGGASLTASGIDQLELKQKAEERERLKIQQDVFGNIANLLVAVSVKIDGKSVSSKVQTMDQKNTLTKPKRTQEQDSTTNGGASGEPGAVPNAIANGELSVGDAAAAAGPSSTEHSETTENDILPSFTHEESTKGPGEGTVVSATVRVPRSHFVNALRSLLNLPSDKLPDAAATDEYVKKALLDMEKDVRASAGMAPEALVAVTAYDDAPVPLTGSAVPGTATTSIPLSIGAHGKEIALGGLALVSLFMVSMMVKRSAPPPVIAAAIPTAGPPSILTVGETLAGQAGDGSSMLDGMELDEDAVRTQQMLDQVSTMVKDNPDAAASLVKRWLNRD